MYDREDTSTGMPPLDTISPQRRSFRTDSKSRRIFNGKASFVLFDTLGMVRESVESDDLSSSSLFSLDNYDCGKMMSHIFDCICALKHVESEQLQLQNNKSSVEGINFHDRSDMRVFLLAISAILNISNVEEEDNDENEFTTCDAFRTLAQVFPRSEALVHDHNQIGRYAKSWLPLHWATVLGSCCSSCSGSSTNNGHDTSSDSTATTVTGNSKGKGVINVTEEVKKILTAEPEMLHWPHIKSSGKSTSASSVSTAVQTHALEGTGTGGGMSGMLKTTTTLESGGKDVIGCMPCHLLAAAKNPNMELAAYFSLIDPHMAYRLAVESSSGSRSRYSPPDTGEIPSLERLDTGTEDDGSGSKFSSPSLSDETLSSSPDLQVVEELCARDEVGYLPLHMAAIYSDSIEMFRFLLQCNPGATRARAGPLARTPLHFLISRPCSKTDADLHTELLLCLMAADPESALIGDSDGLTPFHLVFSRSCLKSIEKTIAGMLSLCPTVAKIPSPKYGMYPVHLAVSFLNGQLCEAVLPGLLEAFKEAAAIRDSRGHLVAFQAAQFSTRKVLELLLEAHPEALVIRDKGGRNIYHRATSRADGDADVTRYLSAKYPEIVKAVDEKGLTPLHFAVYYGKDIDFLRAVYEADPSAIKVKTSKHNALPAHVALVLALEYGRPFAPLSKRADFFRFLLNKHPAAASISFWNRRTPYAYCLSKNAPVYLLRLLLQADTTISPDALRRLNYQERRNAMFLAFTAISRDEASFPNILSRLRQSDGGELCLLKQVISFI